MLFTYALSKAGDVLPKEESMIDLYRRAVICGQMSKRTGGKLACGVLQAAILTKGFLSGVMVNIVQCPHHV